MSPEARETLSLGLAHGHSLRTVASVLGRAPSTVSRESTRSASRDRPHRACAAQTLAVARACQPRRPRKLLNPWLWQYVRTHLAEGCSPGQIAGRRKRVYPNDMGTQLSAETIYAGLYVLLRGTLRSEQLTALRQARKGVGLGQEEAIDMARSRAPQWVGHRDPGGANDTLGHLGTEGGDGRDECP
jgi:transposase, IS30 family